VSGRLGDVLSGWMTWRALFGLASEALSLGVSIGEPQRKIQNLVPHKTLRCLPA
jgi:hypothetical protein